jgi:hypothetical protein
LVGHFCCWIVGPYGSLQVGRIDVLAMGPFDEVGRAVGWIGTPPLEYAGVDCLVDVDVAAVVSHIGLSADGPVERRKDLGVIPREKGPVGVGSRCRHGISIQVDL